MRRRLRSLLASMVVIGSIAGVQAAPVLAAHGAYSGVRSDTCGHHGDSNWEQHVLSISGTYVRYYMWEDQRFEAWMSACGASAPYGSYFVSATKQITAKWWVNAKGISSCTVDTGLSMSCVATANQVSATFKTAKKSGANSLVLTVNEVAFPDIPGPTTYDGYQSVTDNMTYAANSYVLTFTNSVAFN